MSFPTIQADDAFPDCDVSTSASVESQISPESPAVVELCVRNEAPSSRRFTFGTPPPFHGMKNESGPAELFIIPPEYEENHAPKEHLLIPDSPEADGCWRAHTRFVGYDTTRGVTIDPGEAFCTEYVPLMQPREQRCFPAGTYEFESRVRWREDGEWFGPYDWELELTVEES